jgi:hypothetical protein
MISDKLEPDTPNNSKDVLVLRLTSCMAALFSDLIPAAYV